MLKRVQSPYPWGDKMILQENKFLIKKLKSVMINYLFKLFLHRYNIDDATRLSFSLGKRLSKLSLK